MGIEIERKFLVNIQLIDLPANFQLIKQGYIAISKEFSVRVRHTKNRSSITIKSNGSGILRSEYEYEIPTVDAEQLLEQCNPRYLTKKRYVLNFAGKECEIDVFLDSLSGLTLAEIELTSPNEKIELPGWITREVTNDIRYRNQSLIFAKTPPSERYP